MNLPARVRQALNEAVHPTEFERCACALLQSRYPGLSAVEGGHDFGRDADIYFPSGGTDPQARGRLLVTTGDPVANVRNGLRRMHQEGLRVDLVVVACSQPVNARAREALYALCSERGLPPAHVYAQEWFVRELVQDAAWRRSLLGIEGRLGALVQAPLHEPIAMSLPLVGRQEEVDSLIDAVSAGRDVVVVGVPGVGKTRLTGQLGDRAVYCEPTALSHLYDDLLLTRPEAVIVDDAHAHPDAVHALRQARRQTGVAFSVVTTTWPDQLENVRGWLSEADVLDVGLLERAEMNALVMSAGVTDYRSRATVLDQAAGRPGWALMLCESLARGRNHDVLSGRAHVAHVERYLSEVTSSHTVLDTLACVAALGGASPETLYALAPLIGVAPAELSGMIESLAHNGLVEYQDDVWQLQPTLRPALVARWFFTTPVRRPWTTLEVSFPDHALSLASAAMSAAEVSSTQRSRDLVEMWVRSLPAATSWDISTFTVVAQYARLDTFAAEFATNAALSVLAVPREPVEAYGIAADPIGDAAIHQLIESTRRFLLPEAIMGLLALAVGDRRRRNSTPDHPLRVLSDLAGVIDPDFGTSLEIRTRLLSAVLNWIRTYARAEEQWCVATEALAGIFSVEVSGNWQDPGALNTVTLASGIEAEDNLSGLLRLWEQVVPLLTSDAFGADRVTCPPRALVVLLDMALGWVRLGFGVALKGQTPSPKQTQYGAEGGSRILESLHPLLQSSSGTALRAHRDLARIRRRSGAAGYDLPVFEIDPDLQSFCEWGDIDFTDDYETASEQVSSRATALATKLAALGPVGGVARFVELADQACLVGKHTGQLTVIRMSELMTDPEAWYREAAASKCSTLLGAALTQWIIREPDAIPIAVLEAALGDARTRPAVIRAVLARGVVDRVADLAIDLMRAEDTVHLEMLSQREANGVLYRLLVHAEPAIAASAAVSFGMGTLHGPALRPEWQTAWRSAIHGMCIDHLTQHNQWRAGQVLAYVAEHDADTFEGWFCQKLQDMGTRGWFTSPLPHDRDGILAHLPRPHRMRLASRYIGLLRVGPSPLVHLVNSDVELARQLLDEYAVSADALVEALAGQRNTALERIGPLLLERGVRPEKIAAAVGWYDAWSGDRSRVHAELLEYFTSLANRVPALRAVSAAGRSQQQGLLREAEEKERTARVRGW